MYPGRVGLVLAICVSLKLVACCSIASGTKLKDFTYEETIALAPVVVSGTDTYHAPQGQESWNFTFTVSCVFKSNGLEIPREIFLIDVGASTCSGTKMETVGTSYIVGLERATSEDIFRGAGDGDYFGKDSEIPYYFKMFEPETWANGAFPASEENLEKASMLCGMDDVIISLGEGNVGDHECPVRNVTSDTCINTSGASGIWNSSMIGLSIYAVMWIIMSLSLET